MQKLIAILQIKSRRKFDFEMWLKWYIDFIKCDEIYICDDNSEYDLVEIIDRLKKNTNVHYIKMNELDISHESKSFNRQQKNINVIFKLCKPNQNDIIILPDDDEFWWFNTSIYNSFKECVNDYRKRFNNILALYVPWTYMRSKEPLVRRDKQKNFAECFYYRSNINECPHKPILFYNGPLNTSFHCGYKEGKSITSIGSEFFKSKCSYTENLRCYHFRFTTEEEFIEKRKGEISYNYARPYFTTSFVHPINDGKTNEDKYDILDKTVLEQYEKIK